MTTGDKRATCKTYRGIEKNVSKQVNGKRVAKRALRSAASVPRAKQSSSQKAKAKASAEEKGKRKPSAARLKHDQLFCNQPTHVEAASVRVFH